MPSVPLDTAATLAPVFVGGIVRRMVDAKRNGKPTDSDPGVLDTSGMIVGEGLVVPIRLISPAVS